MLPGRVSTGAMHSLAVLNTRHSIHCRWRMPTRRQRELKVRKPGNCMANSLTTWTFSVLQGGPTYSLHRWHRWISLVYQTWQLTRPSIDLPARGIEALQVLRKQLFKKHRGLCDPTGTWRWRCAQSQGFSRQLPATPKALERASCNTRRHLKKQEPKLSTPETAPLQPKSALSMYSIVLPKLFGRFASLKTYSFLKFLEGWFMGG